MVAPSTHVSRPAPLAIDYPRIASLHMAAGPPKSRMHPPHHSHDPELAPGCSSMDSETQVYRANENRTVMQARKKSLWRQPLGVTYALTVVFTPGEGQVSISLES
jgi:hypothetical protein